ncbi:YitT family protein [Cohnella mopanensis]|uniref:YitT family protein n=1 Tax=Cohnella mopanensis TaxID=2911966 RepID=UPI001EF76A77|nr:YitT family protein [Cohnella mopanensis]
MLSLQKTITIVVGSLLIAIGIDFFLMPIKVLDGGFIGLALIGNYLFQAKAGIILIALSLPVFIYTWRMARGMFFHSLFGMVLLSYFIDLLDAFNPLGSAVHAYPFVASIIGGTCIGIGFGILLRIDTSTGGMDLLASLLAPRLRLNVGVLILMMDAIVIILGGLLFSLDTFFLSIATIVSGGLATSLCTSKYFTY